MATRYLSPTTQAAMSVGISREFARSVITYARELEVYARVTGLKTIEVTLPSDVIKFINDVSSALGVSTDAVIGSILSDKMEELYGNESEVASVEVPKKASRSKKAKGKTRSKQ